MLSRFRGGDPGAAAEVRRVVTAVISCKGYYVPFEQREDVIQDTLLGVWKAAARPDFEVRRDFLSFAKRVALRRCVDWMRSRGKEKLVQAAPPREEASRPDAALFAEEKRRIRDRVMSQLRDSHRELIRLCVDSGLSYREVARLQNRTEQAVRRQWCDCLKEAGHIRKRLEGDQPGSMKR
jgi:RNA polymerase sigma factor (sigma-70 family)